MIEQTIIILIADINRQQSESGKRAARIRLLKQYYLLSDEDQLKVDELIQPFLYNDRNEKAQSDLSLDQAEVLLSRLEKRQLVIR